MFGKIWQYISSLWRLPDPPSSPQSLEPDVWKDEAIEYCNNCYAYASKHPLKNRRRFPQPGGKSGLSLQQHKRRNVQQLVWLAEKDGLTRTFLPVAKPGHYLVALVVTDEKMDIPPDKIPQDWDEESDECWDYHWYRQDADGTWSHKPGGCPVRREDENGLAITDPKTCARGLYRHFIGWFHVPNEGLPVEQLQDDPEVLLKLPQPRFR